MRLPKSLPQRQKLVAMLPLPVQCGSANLAFAGVRSFSQGNLQYQASTNTWRFAESQFAYCATANGNIAENSSEWIDLFGWGTSGYNHGAVCYQPWSTSMDNDDYYAYGQYNKCLYDGDGQADWGYNAISNGGNQTGLWRTPKSDEWDYMINYRETPSGLRFAVACVDGVNGVIVLLKNSLSLPRIFI